MGKIGGISGILIRKAIIYYVYHVYLRQKVHRTAVETLINATERFLSASITQAHPNPIRHRNATKNDRR